MNCTIKRKPYGNKPSPIHLWLVLHHNKMLVFHMHISHVAESPCIAPTMSEGNLNIRNVKKMGKICWKINTNTAPSDMECDITGHRVHCGVLMDQFT